MLVLIAAGLLAALMLGNHWAQEARDKALRAIPRGASPPIDAGGCLLASEQADLEPPKRETQRTLLEVAE